MEGFGQYLADAAQDSFWKEGMGKHYMFGVSAELPMHAQGTPEYIRQSGLIDHAHMRKTNTADSQLYSSIMLASREEPFCPTVEDHNVQTSRLYEGVLVAYPSTPAGGDVPKEKHIERWLAQVQPYPDSSAKQPSAFKARRHANVQQVVRTPPGRISPFTLGSQFLPGIRHTQEQHVQEIATVLFVRPTEKHGKSILVPIRADTCEYIEYSMQEYHRFIEAICRHIPACYLVNAS